MHQPGITIVGLGPGNPHLLTRQAWDVFGQIEDIYLRTLHHLPKAAFPSHLKLHSFDNLYDGAEDFEDVYIAIVEKILELGQQPQGVVYGVPGHPFVCEATTPEITRRARLLGLPVTVIEGLSFLEPTLTALGLDPFPRTALIDALELTSIHTPPFPPNTPAIIAQIYAPQIAAEVKLTLMYHYPDDFAVRLVHAAGTSHQVVEDLPLYRIDQSGYIGLQTALFVPPLGEATSYEEFLEVVARLRAPDGCPWDREQTHQSLRSYLLEETYEVLEMLDTGDMQSLQEELGDLLLQILLHAQIASEAGEFTMVDVLRSIHHKIVFRHPHVFGNIEVENSQEVFRNWERLKIEERQRNGKGGESLLNGVAKALPALAQAEQYLRRTSRAGFAWPDIPAELEGVEKFFKETTTPHSTEEKVGSALFAIANLACQLGVDPESALRKINTGYRNRLLKGEEE